MSPSSAPDPLLQGLKMQQRWEPEGPSRRETGAKQSNTDKIKGKQQPERGAGAGGGEAGVGAPLRYLAGVARRGVGTAAGGKSLP